MIEKLRTYYPSIDEATFDRLIRLDPTFKEGKDSVGTYGKWILNLYKKGNLSNEGHVHDLLIRFNKNKKNLINKDINTYKTLIDVDKALNNPSSYKELSHRQEVRINQKSRHNADIDTDLIYENNTWALYSPSSYANSCKLGEGTHWCTASTETQHYYRMYLNQYANSKYYIFINKNTKEKFQLHSLSNQFMDKNDCPVNYDTFLNRLREHENNILVQALDKMKQYDENYMQEINSYNKTMLELEDEMRYYNRQLNPLRNNNSQILKQYNVSLFTLCEAYLHDKNRMSIIVNGRDVLNIFTYNDKPGYLRHDNFDNNWYYMLAESRQEYFNLLDRRNTPTSEKVTEYFNKIIADPIFSRMAHINLAQDIEVEDILESYPKMEKALNNTEQKRFDILDKMPVYDYVLTI